MARVVVDANRIFSALLRDGAARHAPLTSKAMLFAPVFLLQEIEKHTPEIARRSAKAPADVAALLAQLRPHIHWVATETIRASVPAAKRALGSVDLKDVPYLACALAVRADAIWSLDLDFDRQALVPRIPHPDAEIA